MNETKLYFNPTTKVIFASAGAQDAAIQSVTLDQVSGLVDDGATIDSSAATVIDAAADAAKAPEVATPGEGVQGADASTGTGTSAALGGDGPLGSEASGAASASGSMANSSDLSASTPGMSIADHVDEGKSIISAMREHVDTEHANLRLKYHAWLDKLEAVFHRI